MMGPAAYNCCQVKCMLQQEYHVFGAELRMHHGKHMHKWMRNGWNPCVFCNNVVRTRHTYQ
jgi:hypothetical protein